MAHKQNLVLGSILEEIAPKIMVFQGDIPQDQGFLSFVFWAHKKEGGLLGQEGVSRGEQCGACPSFLPCLVRPHIEFFAFGMCGDSCLGFVLRSLGARGSPENGQHHASAFTGAILRMC